MVGCANAVRGIFAGGTNPISNVISYVMIPSSGNAQDFGDLSASLMGGGQCANGTRALYAGGRAPTSSSADNKNISFTTIASTGNYVDSGFDLSTEVSCRGTSNSTRGLFGSFISPYADTIDYVTIQHLGTAQDFGNLTEVRGYGMAVSSPVRAVFAGGIRTPNNLGVNTMDYVTISSTGNAADYGDLLSATSNCQAFAGVANATRGMFAGGTTGTRQDIIQYTTIDTNGNTIDFGNLTVGRASAAGVANKVRGVCAGGRAAPVQKNEIDFITFKSFGNATDFGDLTSAKRGLGTAASVSYTHLTLPTILLV